MQRMSLIILAALACALAGCGKTAPADVSIGKIIADIPPAAGVQAARVYERSELSLAGMPAAVKVGERPWVGQDFSGVLTIWIYNDDAAGAGAFQIVRQANPLPANEAGLGDEAFAALDGATVWIGFRRCQAVALLRLEGQNPADTRRYLTDLDQALQTELCP